MPPKVQKEAPLTPELRDRLNDLTARHRSSDTNETATTVEEWKALGNACFSSGSYLTAIKCYTRPIADMADQGGDSAVLRSNRSAAYLKSSMFSGPALALKDAEAAVAREPQWFKGYLRLGDAQFAREKYDEAEAAYEHALRLDGTCEAARASLKEARKEKFLRELDVQEKEKWGAEEAEREQRREAGEYNAASAGRAWSTENVNTTLNTTFRNSSNSGDGGGVTKEAAAEEGTPEKPPFEFHNAPIRFSHEDDAVGWGSSYGTPGDAGSSGGGSGGVPLSRRRRPPPTEEETAELIRTWKRDLVPRDDEGDHTASGISALAPPPPQPQPSSSWSPTSSPSAVRTAATTSPGAGLAYKERLLGQFRSKVAENSDLSETLRAKRLEELRKGECVDYREGDRYREMYEKATNGIGLGISADAYKEHTGTERHRW